MGWNKKSEKSDYPNVNGNPGEAAGSTGTGVQEPPKQETPATPATPATPDASGWQKVENKQDGSFYKFEREGEELVGKYLGSFAAGKNKWGNPNTNCKLKTADGIALVTTSQNLDRQLETVATGKEIKIKYLGKKMNKKTGNYYKDFEVSVKV
jgi:hypothetical protein